MMQQYRRSSDDSGVTLVELLVVLLLAGVIGGIVTAGVVTSLRSASFTDRKIDALNELQIAGQLVVRDLRASEVIILSESPSVLLRVEVRGEDGQLRPITYGVVDQQLIRVDGSDRAIVTALANSEDEPVFNFFDAVSGFAPNPTPIEPCNSSGCAGLAVVRVRLMRDVQDGSPIIVETDASVRNLRYGSVILP